jgi:hypothetical protein
MVPRTCPETSSALIVQRYSPAAQGAVKRIAPSGIIPLFGRGTRPPPCVLLSLGGPDRAGALSKALASYRFWPQPSTARTGRRSSPHCWARRATPARSRSALRVWLAIPWSSTNEDNADCQQLPKFAAYYENRSQTGRVRDRSRRITRPTGTHGPGSGRR